MWCVPELTEEYIDRMEDVLDLYELPLSAGIKNPLFLDEKPVQLLDHGREPILATNPGEIKKVDYK